MCSSHNNPLSFACFVAACLTNSALRCDAAFNVTGGRIVAVRAAAVPSTVMMRRGMPAFGEGRAGGSALGGRVPAAFGAA